jgi:sorbitol-6-phosphate 2-dehydrogenase
MSELSHPFAAPLARGLYLDAFSRPVFLVSTGAESAGAEALSVDLGSSGDEVAAASSLKEALASWKAKKGASSMPGCLILRSGAFAAAYWPGLGYDEARRRSERRDASALLVPPAADIPPGSARRRGQVVEGRIALVTGGAQGFGEEIVRGLVSSGAFVYVADLNLAGAEKLSAALNAESGGTVSIPVSVNVSDEASVAAMLALAAQRTGGVDLVVSNAGVLKAYSVLEQDLGSFKFVTDVNYVGFMLMAKHSGLVLRRQSRTAPRWTTDIIQVNSKSGLEGSNKNGSYAGSKFGGIGLVQSFALELVEWKVKVNAICPGNFLNGPLWSDPVKGLFVQYLNSGKVKGAKTIEDVRASYEGKVPMHRGCEGADVMRAVYYLVEQEYETGQALPVTGGQVMLN